MTSANWHDFQEMDFLEFQKTNPEPSSFAFMQGDGAGNGCVFFFTNFCKVSVCLGLKIHAFPLVSLLSRVLEHLLQ